jgi:hypothetical protein
MHLLSCPYWTPEDIQIFTSNAQKEGIAGERQAGNPDPASLLIFGAYGKAQMENTNLTAALWYAEKMNFSVIPILPGDKRPLIKWEEFQKRRATRAEIISWWSRNPDANVGIVTGSISDIAVVDIDTDEGKEAILEYIPDSVITPTLKTPKGGNHLYFRYPKDLEIRNNARTIPGCDFRGEGGYVVAPPSKNGNGNSYEWLPDLSISKLLPSILPIKYIDKINTITKTNSLYRDPCSQDKLQAATPTTSDYKMLQEGTRDNDLFKIGMCLADGHAPVWMMQEVLERLALTANPPFPIDEVSIKIQSIMNRVERKERNITDEVREFVLTTNGYFLTTDCYNGLQVTTRNEKKAITVALIRLQRDGMIEKCGEKNGCFRKVDKDVRRTKFIAEEIQEFPVILPLNLNELCRLYAKNIMVIAGTKSGGKTAMLLKMAMENQRHTPVVYLNSEMGDEEFSERMKKFGVRDESHIKFDVIECHNNFHDSVTGEKKIFIIDFMEIHDNFYEIAKQIRLIHEKLQEGIAIIAVQKKKDAYLGRGAEFSMEKARLYLNLDYDEERRATKITIVDAKAPKRPGVRGGFIYSKIIDGTKFSPTDTWRFNEG